MLVHPDKLSTRPPNNQGSRHRTKCPSDFRPTREQPPPSRFRYCTLSVFSFPSSSLHRAPLLGIVETPGVTYGIEAGDNLCGLDSVPICVCLSRPIVRRGRQKEQLNSPEAQPTNAQALFSARPVRINNGFGTERYSRDLVEARRGSKGNTRGADEATLGHGKGRGWPVMQVLTHRSLLGWKSCRARKKCVRVLQNFAEDTVTFFATLCFFHRASIRGSLLTFRQKSAPKRVFILARVEKKKKKRAL